MVNAGVWTGALDEHDVAGLGSSRPRIVLGGHQRIEQQIGVGRICRHRSHGPNRVAVGSVDARSFEQIDTTGGQQLAQRGGADHHLLFAWCHVNVEAGQGLTGDQGGRQHAIAMVTVRRVGQLNRPNAGRYQRTTATQRGTVDGTPVAKALEASGSVAES